VFVIVKSNFVPSAIAVEIANDAVIPVVPVCVTFVPGIVVVPLVSFTVAPL